MDTAEFKLYNRLAEKMDYFHSILRSTWNQIYAGTDPNPNEPSLSTSRLITLGLHFCDHLEGHHDIEETYWYPVLAAKMEEFSPGHFARAQHQEIHSGLEALAVYLKDCQRGVRDLKRDKVRGLMDSFGKVLFRHLDEEVKELGAENMKRYWTAEEMRAFPF